MNEVSLQNTVIKVSAAKDAAQSKDTKKTDSTFKSILEGISSEKSTSEKKSLDVSKNTVYDDSKAEVIKDSKLEVSNVDSPKISDGKSEGTNDEKTEVLNDNEVKETADDTKTSIKLSNDELSELETFIDKLQFLVNKTDSESKSDTKVKDVLQLFQMNLTKLNNALDALKNKDISAVDANNEVQPQAQLSLDLIDELGKIQNKITDMMSTLSTSSANKETKLNDEAKNNIDVDLSEGSKKDAKDSDIILELCGMASILSQVAVLKTEQIQNVNNTSEVQAKEALKEVKALNGSLSVLKELLENRSQVNPENKKEYLSLAQIAENTISSKKDNLVVSVDKLNLKEVPESKEAVSSILKLLTNNNENSEVNLKTGSEIEKLINKFVNQTNELGQKLKLSNEVKNSQFVKADIPSTASIVDNNATNFAKKLTNDVRRKIENGDTVFDKEQNKFIIYEEKTDTSFRKEPLVQTTSSDVKTEKSSLNKEDKLLLKLASDEKGTAKDDVSSKIARVTNLATSLQVEKNVPVEPTEKLPVVNRQTFNEDIVKSIKYMELNQVKELTVKVMPKELGELYIKITREGEVVKAQITATNKEAYNVLNSNLSDITKQLSEQNIKIHTFNVEIFNGDSGFYNQGSKNENGNSQSKRKNSFGSLEVEELGNTEDILNDFNNVNALA